MSRHEHLVLCGGLTGQPVTGGSTLNLSLYGQDKNTELKITDISRRMVTTIPDVLSDLLEVASYVYTADAAVSRGGPADVAMGKRWRRNFRLVIPVRRPELWSSGMVQSALVDTLSFLSDDDYQFEFQLYEDPPAGDGFFDFGGSQGSGFNPDELILFSGGLDSFAGAVEELAERGKRIALVSHWSAPTITHAQRNLIHDVRERFGASRVMHIPVWMRLTGTTGTELTHRSRSFLFAALATVVARLFGRDRILFFENGVVSLNFPLVDQVVGSRATRTTHPQTLAGFQRFFSALLGRTFLVDNPYIWKTKTEIVERIAANDCADLIRHTRSCAHVREMTKLHSHCGRCSQCIDRRFAILAADLAQVDPEEAYKLDLLMGARPAGPDREMALAYVRSATRINNMDDMAFFANYGEASRVVGYFDELADVVATKILDLHRRHATAVCQVFDDAVKANASAFREGTLAPDCLLSLGAGGTVTPAPATVPSDPSLSLEDREPEIRICIDERKSLVHFHGWGTLKGVSADLIIALAGPHRGAVREELAPEKYPFTETKKLVAQTRSSDEEAFRQRVLKCRNKIVKLATEAGGPAPPMDAVIENSPWRGYRLNPDRIRIVALSEANSNE